MTEEFEVTEKRKPVEGQLDFDDCVEKSIARENSREKKKKAPASVSAARARQLDEEADEMRRGRDWSEAGPGHLVSLWAWCHRAVYGVEASTSPRERASAHALAKKLISDRFSGDARAAVAFVRWCWEREKGREKWRREQGKSGSVLGWRAQFGARYLFVDYDVDRRRTS